MFIFLFKLLLTLLLLVLLGNLLLRYVIYKVALSVRNIKKEDVPVPSSQQEMIDMAKKKKDEDMTEEEFNVKYGAQRYATYRISQISKNSYDTMNKMLHFIELYCVHYGPNNLKKKVPDIVKPIFVIGDFRSGTSNLERIISHHKDLGYFDMTNLLVWQAPKIWNYLYDCLAYINEKAHGEKEWIHPSRPGVYNVASSEMLLTSNRPFECEIIWYSCKNRFNRNRNYNWKTLDTDENEDNNSNHDLLDENYDDPNFEQLFKETIRMLLSHQKKTRFISKNPLNGFRVGYLHKMFPDAKFVFISRNPLKTVKSQLLLEDQHCRAMYMNPKEFRENSMNPSTVCPVNSKGEKNKKTWQFLMHSQLPNPFFRIWWSPREFPRTVPEYKKINEYLKKDMKPCAFAQALVQQERVAIQAFERCKIIEGKNLFTLYNEDLLENAIDVMTNLFRFLELEITNKDVVSFLEKEDFAQGKAAEKRILSPSNVEKGITFENEIITNEVNSILEPSVIRYKNRKRFIKK